jgi:mono/diheme cytochrome c family protein
MKLIKIIFFLLCFAFYHQNVLATHHDAKMLIKKSVPKSEDFLIGEKIYQNNCVSCHQKNLSGHPKWKTALDKDGHRVAPPLNGTGHTWHHDDRTLFAIIKYGLNKLVKNYQGKMLGFGDKLSDQEIKQVLSYIKSYWNDEAYNYQLKLN